MAEAAGLASSIITFLDLTTKIVKRTLEISRTAQDGPAYLKTIQTQLPLLEKSLEATKRQALARTLPPDVCTELVKIVNSAREEIEKLHKYLLMLGPSPTRKNTFSKFNLAVKSVLKYDDKIESTLEKLKTYVDAMNFFQITAASGKSDDMIRALRLIQNNQTDLVVAYERDKIRKWIDGKPRDGYIDACNSRRAPSTCTWIFDTTEYVQWRTPYFNTEPKVLWIHGAPGFGKTFIAANIFSQVEESDEAAAVFWTSEAKFGNAPLSEIPRSWVTQLLTLNLDYCDHVKQFWQASKADRATERDIWDALKAILKSSPTPITLAIDGLDEYNHQHFQRLTSDQLSHQTSLQYESVTGFLRALKDELRTLNCRILCVSQPDGEIRGEISASKLITEGFKYAFEHSITKEDVKQDVSAFAKHVIDTKLPKKEGSLRQELTKMVSEKAEGQMLWISLQEREKNYLRPSFSEKKCRKVVQDTPGGVDYIYQANLDRILRLDEYERNRALRLLNWVMNSLRSLSVHELVEAMLVEDDEDLEEIDEDELPDDPDEEDVYGELRNLCGNFIAFDIDEKRKEPRYWKVRFAHSSIRAYLTKNLSEAVSTQAKEEGDDAAGLPLLGALCLRYLMCSNIWPQLNGEAELKTVCSKTHPLLSYAGTYFPLHLETKSRNILEPLLDKFFVHYYEPYQKWQTVAKQVKDADCTKLGVAPKEKWTWVSRLAFAAGLGLKQAVEAICDAGKFDDAKELAPAYVAACWYGDLSLVTLLETRGAEVNMPEDGTTPLHAACSFGHREVVEHLIANGADCKATTTSGTPLHKAAQKGHDEVVGILLDHGADATAVDMNGRLPLHDAVLGRRHQTVKRLLMEESLTQKTINEVTYRGWSPLLSAADLGEIEIVRLLLDKGSIPNAIGYWGRTPLYTSALQGFENVFDVLFERNHDVSKIVNEVTEWDGTSLLIGAIKGKNLGIVKKLVDNGADINLLDYASKSPLTWAILQDSAPIVEYLLSVGAEPDSRMSTYGGWTPLQIACQSGSAEFVKLFLSKGANAKVQTNYGCTALEIASYNGHKEVVEILLQDAGGASTINQPCKSLHTPLIEACKSGNIGVVQVLLDHGADPLVKTQPGFSVLDEAAASGKQDMVAFLIDACGPQTFSQDYPLHCAAEGGSRKIFDLLYKHFKLNSKTYQMGQNVWHCAAYGGDTEIMGAIIREADITLLKNRDSTGWTPLQWALQGPKRDVAEMLLDLYSKQSPPQELESKDVIAAVLGGDTACLKLLLKEDKTRVLKARTEMVGRTPLNEAIKKGKYDIAKLLISEGASLSEENYMGFSCLHYYAAYEKEGMDKLFQEIDWSTELVRRSHAGLTPTLYACVNGRSGALRRFLRQGASLLDRRTPIWPITMSRLRGGTTMHGAAGCGNIEVAKIIADTCGSAAYKWRDDWGRTPAHTAASPRDGDYMLKHLQSQGVDLCAETIVGETPLMLALVTDCQHAATFLIKEGAIPSDKARRSLCLMYAASCKDVSLLKTFDEQDVKVETFSCVKTTLLHNAASYAEEAIITYLLGKGLRWDTVDDHGWTPEDCLRATALKKLKELPEEIKQRVSDKRRGWQKPTKWNLGPIFSKDFILSHEDTNARLTPLQDTGQEKKQRRIKPRGLRANHFLLPTAAGSYFEITIKECPKTSAIGIGVDEMCEAGLDFDHLATLYLGDTGFCKPDNRVDDTFSECYGQGDTIGCGIDYEASALYFTKNGKCLGTAFKSYYGRKAPYICTLEETLEIEANFGQKPFLFDAASHGYGDKSCFECYGGFGELRARCGEET